MMSGNMIGKQQLRLRSLSRRAALILVWAVGVPLGHTLAPWAISLLSTRSGWDMTRPGTWNTFGLIPIGLGISGLVWVMIAASIESPARIELRSAAFLMTRGPYAYSRNPMYVSELTLWLGWSVFYGGLGVLVGFLILLSVVVPAARYEERRLEARFGESYRSYTSRVPRWLGARHSMNRTPHRCEPPQID